MGLAYGGAIVRDGLVLALDAADRNSYPGSGTSIYNLSGNTSAITINSLSFITVNGGGVQCNTNEFAEEIQQNYNATKSRFGL